MPTVRRRRDGLWGVIVDGPPHPNGRRNQVRVQERTRPEAQEAMLAIQQERLASQEASRGGPTLGEFIARWATASLPNLAAKTAVRYQGIIDKYLADDSISAIPVRDLTDQNIRDWQARVRQKPGRRGPTLSTRSLRHVAALLRQVLKAAVEWGETDANPALKVPLPSIRRDPEKIKAWRPDEVRHYCDGMARSSAANAGFWLLVTILALTTGLRRGELPDSCGPTSISTAEPSLSVAPASTRVLPPGHPRRRAAVGPSTSATMPWRASETSGPSRKPTGRFWVPRGPTPASCWCSPTVSRRTPTR